LNIRKAKCINEKYLLTVTKYSSFSIANISSFSLFKKLKTGVIAVEYNGINNAKNTALPKVIEQKLAKIIIKLNDIKNTSKRVWSFFIFERKNESNTIYVYYFN
jgi:hypothetical protein